MKLVMYIEYPHYERKVSNLQSRYDEQYDIIEDIENQIDEVKKQIDSIVQENLSGTSVYNLLLAFNKLYKDFTEAEQKEFMRAFIDRIDIYPEKKGMFYVVRKYSDKSQGFIIFFKKGCDTICLM